MTDLSQVYVVVVGILATALCCLPTVQRVVVWWPVHSAYHLVCARVSQENLAGRGKSNLTEPQLTWECREVGLCFSYGQAFEPLDPGGRLWRAFWVVVEQICVGQTLSEAIHELSSLDWNSQALSHRSCVLPRWDKLSVSISWQMSDQELTLRKWRIQNCICPAVVLVLKSWVRLAVLCVDAWRS